MSLSTCAFVPYARTRLSLSIYHTHAIKIIHSLILYIKLAMAKSEAPVNKFIILKKQFTSQLTLLLRERLSDLQRNNKLAESQTVQ